MRLEDYDTTQRYEAVVQSSELISARDAADEVRELILDVRDVPALEVGQNIGVLAPGEEAFGKQEHLRLYSIADIPQTADAGGQQIKIAVKRVSYIDDYSGEKYPGRASNFLCDRKAGDKITITGPYGSAFRIPEEKDANLILIGMGTGIAPFRAFIKLLYQRCPDFTGAVRLFYGAYSGLELFYMNEERDDFAQYYDRDTFKAFKALSPRPHWADPIAWDEALQARGEEILKMLHDHKTYVYVAGLEQIREQLDAVFTEIMQSKERWERRKAELQAGQRWVELLY